MEAQIWLMHVCRWATLSAPNRTCAHGRAGMGVRGWACGDGRAGMGVRGWPHLRRRGSPEGDCSLWRHCSEAWRSGGRAKGVCATPRRGGTRAASRGAGGRARATAAGAPAPRAWRRNHTRATRRLLWGTHRGCLAKGPRNGSYSRCRRRLPAWGTWGRYGGGRVSAARVLRGCCARAARVLRGCCAGAAWVLRGCCARVRHGDVSPYVLTSRHGPKTAFICCLPSSASRLRTTGKESRPSNAASSSCIGGPIQPTLAPSAAAEAAAAARKGKSRASAPSPRQKSAGAAVK